MTPAQRAALRKKVRLMRAEPRQQQPAAYNRHSVERRDLDEILDASLALLDDLDAAEQRVDALGCIAGNLSLCGHLHEHAPDMCPVCIVEKKLAALEAREKRLREALKHAAACRFPFCEECERLTRALAEPDARGTK